MLGRDHSTTAHPEACPRLVLLLALFAPWPALALDSLTVVGLFRDKAVVDIDGKQVLLTLDKEGPEGVRLISADSRQAVIEVQGERRTFELGQRIAGVYAPPEAKPMVQVAPDAAGTYQVDGTLEGFAVRFLVDTGADTVAFNREVARRIGLDYKRTGTRTTIQGATGSAPAYGVTLKKLTLGAIALTDVPAVVVDGDFPAEVLLGNSVLSRLGMVRHGRVLELHAR